MLVASLLFAAERGVAQSPASTQPATQPAPLTSHYAPLALDSPYATGDWLGLRTAAEDAGIATQFFYNNTYQWIVKGGLDRLGKNGATIDWFVTADLQKLKLIPGGSLLVHVRRQWGEGVNPYTGSLWQVADDLDGDRTLHIDQLYYEQLLLDNRISLKTGFLDYQTIVDRNAYANAEDVEFLNQQFDNNPLVPLNIGLGAALTVKPTSWLTVIAGAGDADSVLFKPGFSTAFHGPARFVWYLEPGINITLPPLVGKGKLPGSYRIGMVSDPRVKPVFVPPDTKPALRTYRGDDQGFYLSFDQALFRENDKDAQGLGIFARYGFRHGDINQVANFWSTGLSYQGLIPTRDRDVLGIAVGQSIPSRTYNDKVNRWAEAETVGELYYSISITRWMVITPDVQYISSPGIGSGVDDAIVLGVRTRISF
ncbi:MAG TPA: carbohydrate porin [Phycisphaerae bacterium]|nr:carbohydrate porin [Phycisphaerae bacterium]